MQRIVSFVLLIITSSMFSQNSNLFIPLDIQDAYKNGTRTYDGTVSDNYWVNHTDYNIDVELYPETDLVIGSAKIVYHNESPDSLDRLVLRLYQNILKPGSVRNWIVPDSVLGDGVKILTLKIDNDDVELNTKSTYVSGTNLIVKLDSKLPPNAKIDLEIDWKFKIANRPLRMGNYSGDYFIAYWYPQVAVYDDVFGWDNLQYEGAVEFYNDFNNYEISYTVPDNYVVWSTGDLSNRENVFHENIIERITEASMSDEVVNIITPKDYENNEVTLNSETGKNIWKYKASKVPDIAWAVSNNYNWDAASVEVEPGRRVLTASIHPDSLEQQKHVAKYARESIEYLSKVSPGIPYPWSHTTAFTNKSRGGGMEFPMMQNNSAPKKITRNAGLVIHEIAHNYMPFYMGTNERRAAWMDEGWATFFQRELIQKYDTTNMYEKKYATQYTKNAGKSLDVPMILQSQMMTHGESRTNFYGRPAIAYLELLNLLGDELFHKALHEYMNRWHGKHPIAYDFFFTFDDVADEDLSWFWKPWFFELGYPDLGIEMVDVSEKEVTISVVKAGTMPVRVAVTLEFEDGTEEVIEKSARVWKEKSKVIIKHNTNKKLKSVKLGSPYIPDVVKDNDLVEVN